MLLISTVITHTDLLSYFVFSISPTFSIAFSLHSGLLLNYYHYTLYLFSRGNEEAWKGRCVDLAHLTSVSVLTSFWHKT